VDVTQAEEWRQVTDLAFSKFGKLDILVNNAGTTYRNKVGSPHSINSERIGDVES
jgi:NADP-dependent 3-hydroxy acid dehydrogenase YdfG